MKKIILNSILFVLAFPICLSQDFSKIHDAAYILSNSAYGKEFYIAIPPNEVPNYNENVLEIYVTSLKETVVTLESPSVGMYLSKQVTPGFITTFSSANGETTFQWEVRESEVITDLGLRLIADEPISVYVLNSKSYSSEGYMAIPMKSWGKEYIHCSYYDFNEFREWAGGFIVVSGNGNTEIQIELKGVGKGLAKTKAGREIGDIINTTLNAGQTYMVRGDGKTRGIFDLSGSKITSNKPVGLISFHMRTMIPSYKITNGRDHLSEMMLPVQAWGKEYATVELKRDKGKGDFFRVICSEDNTNFQCVYYDLTTNKKLGIWESTLKLAGDFAEWLEVPVTAGHDLKSIRGMSVFKADKPIMVLQYSYSEQWDGATIFDPFMITIAPDEQYVSNTVFQTPSNKAFIDNWINIVAKGDTTDKDMKLLKSISLDGQPIHFHNAFLKNIIPGTNKYWAKIRVTAGPHVITSDTKIGAYIYGFSNWDSYGWPITMGINKIDIPDNLPPVLVKQEDEHGNVHVEAYDNRPEQNGSTDQGISLVELTQRSFNYELISDSYEEDYKYQPQPKRSFTLQKINSTKPGFAYYAVLDIAGNVTLDSVGTPKWISYNKEEFDYEVVYFEGEKEQQLEILCEGVPGEKALITEISLKEGKYFSASFTGYLPAVLEVEDKFNIRIICENNDENLEDVIIQDTLLVMIDGNYKEFPLSVKFRKLPPQTAWLYYNDLIVETDTIVDDTQATEYFYIKCKGIENGSLELKSVSCLGNNDMSAFSTKNLPMEMESGDSLKIGLSIKIDPGNEDLIEFIDTVHFEYDFWSYDLPVRIIWKKTPVGIPESIINNISINPNPAVSGESVLSFNVIQSSSVEISIFDEAGRIISSEVSRFYENGLHNKRISLKGQPSGTYIVRIRVGDMVSDIRIVNIR